MRVQLTRRPFVIQSRSGEESRIFFFVFPCLQRSGLLDQLFQIFGNRRGHLDVTDRRRIERHVA
jgi:hypothetical protein